MIWIFVAQHAAFFLLFALRVAGVIRPRAVVAAAEGVEARSEPRAASLLTVHGAAFGVFYGAFALALARGLEPQGIRLVVGAAMNTLALGLLAWTLLVFESWRLLAKLDPGHALCTRGPFRWIRHPIYLSCDLLAVGTALAISSALLWAGAILVIIGGDLRGRAEERILAAAFGEQYRRYLARSKRLIPRLY